MSIRFIAATFFAVVIINSVARAELRPAEVAIIAVKGSRESQALAKYYAKQRNVPTSQICLINVPAGETLPCSDWQQRVRPAIRTWMKDNQLEDKIRCFVTVWEVPLRIAKAERSDSLQQRVQFYSAERHRRLAVLIEVVEQAEVKAGDLGDESNAVDTKPDSEAENESELDRLAKRLQRAVTTIQRGILAETDAEQKQRSARKLQQMVSRAAGISSLYDSLSRSLQGQTSPSTRLRAEYDSVRGRISGINEGRAIVELQQLPSVEREQTTLLFVERVGGLIQSIRWLDEKLEITAKNETEASFDSELSLILWPEYELLRWQNNFLHERFDDAGIREVHPTLMVSRLDAPTLKLAKGLIDMAIQTETNGLDGKVYLDGRGLAELDGKPAQAGSFQAYDRGLLQTASKLESNGRLEVILDTKPDLFQPGSCPDAALYCGWYSLAKYVDAFDWQPGAIAYHLASSEAKTLRAGESEVWCKRLLEDGVCATLGPVAEPYLQAFPPPNKFFPLLMSGKYSLVECYYRTKPYNSWMMTLIGDPLYNPFKNRPAYDADVGIN